MVLEFYCLFFRTSWGVGILNLAIFNSFHNRVDFGTILEGPLNSGGGRGFEHLTRPRHTTAYTPILALILSQLNPFFQTQFLTFFLSFTPFSFKRYFPFPFPGQNIVCVAHLVCMLYATLICYQVSD